MTNLKKYEKDFHKKNKHLKPTSGSGAVHNDGDFRMGTDWLIEHKYRNKNTIWIDMRWWDKIRKQALQRNRNPALIFENDDCTVVYISKHDISLPNNAHYDKINNSKDPKLKNKTYTDNTYLHTLYIIEYNDLIIMEYSNFDELTGMIEKEYLNL